MSWLVGIFAVTCGLLVFQVWQGRRLLKRSLQADQAFAARIRTLYDTAHGNAPAEGETDRKTTITELKRACNEQAERHEELDALRRSILLDSVMTAVTGIVMAVTVLFGA